MSDEEEQRLLQQHDGQLFSPPHSHSHSQLRQVPVAVGIASSIDDDRVICHGQGNDEATYHVYKSRWYILFVLVLLNISNGMLWISFSPIADNTAEYFKISASQVNWLAVIFMVVSIVLGFFVIWFLDTCGLRAGIVLSSWLNGVGSAVRIVSCLWVPHGLQYPVLMGGQLLCALAQPLIMFAPTKLAALWFPPSQRVLANTGATVANALGIMIGNLVGPRLVKQPADIPFMMYMYSIPAALGLLLATFGVCSAVPPSPPSSSAAEHADDAMPFREGLKKVVKNKTYLLLALYFGSGVALFTVFNTLLEQMLCPLGYTDVFAGLCSALMIAVGLLGAGCAAVFVDKTKYFEEVAKVGFAIAAVCIIAFNIAIRYPNMEILLAILICLVGFFGFASNPVSLELSVECTFPVAEATSAGVLIMSSQVQGFVYILMMQVLARPFNPSEIPQQTCHTSGVTGVLPQDYTLPDMGLSGIAAVMAASFLIFFHCPYKRLNAEKRQAAEALVSAQGNEHREDAVNS